MSSTTSLKQLVNKRATNSLTSNKLTSSEIQMRALEIAAGLTSTIEPNDMTAWYCKAYMQLGEGRYLMVANMARKGYKPQSLFGWLLRQEMNK